jgi:hypothetical protein
VAARARLDEPFARDGLGSLGDGRQSGDRRGLGIGVAGGRRLDGGRGRWLGDGTGRWLDGRRLDDRRGRLN